MPSPQTSVRSLLIAWFPTLVWCIVIAFESTSFFSGGQTMLWTRRLLSLFVDHPSFILVYKLNHLLRKTGHFIGYATLSWFAFRGWMETLAWQRERYLISIGRPVDENRRWHLRAAILGVLVTIAVAALDEFHQSHLRGRTGVFRDVILDTMGGIFAQCVLLLYWTRRKRGSSSSSRASDISPVTAEET